MGKNHTLYKGEIIKQFYFSGTLSCQELSLLTQKSLPLTMRLLNELVDQGLVIDSGLALSTGGRRPQTYTLQANLLYIVSVAMDQYVTRVAIMDIQNNFVGEVEEMEIVLPNNPNALQQLAEMLEIYLTKISIDRKKIIGVGIGMPGFIDIKKGLNLLFLPHPTGHSITSFLKSRLGLPVYIDNDSSLIALAESKFGDAKERSNCIVINISWGVGLGLILDSKLFRGDTGFAGEFSHIPLFSNNKICSCGKLGCLETESSLLVLVEKAKQGIREGKSTLLDNIENLSLVEASRQILASAKNGDRFVIELLGEIGYNIGRGIAILIHILNPTLIVLSGKGAAAGRLWLAPIQKAIDENCIPLISEKTTIAVSSIGNDAELVGAAALVMEHFEQLAAFKALKNISILDEIA